MAVVVNNKTTTGYSRRASQVATSIVPAMMRRTRCQSPYWVSSYPTSDSMNAVASIPTTGQDSQGFGRVGQEIAPERLLRPSAATILATQDCTESAPFRYTKGISKGISEPKKRLRPHLAAVSQVL